MDAARVFYDGLANEPRLDHPEGVTVAPDGSIWCGGEAGQIYRIEHDGSSAEIVASTGGFVLGVTFDQGGNLYACDHVKRAVYRLPADGGPLEMFADGADGRRFRVPNSPVCDRLGRLYVSDSHAPDQPGPGIFRFDPDGTGELWYDRPLVFANGLALTPDGSAIYVAESFLPGVGRIPIVDDRPGTKEAIAELPGTIPDGLLAGPDGALYVGCYEPSQILRIAPDGRITTVLTDPTAHLLCHPTNLAARGNQLFVANLGRWHITVLDPAPWTEI